MVLLIYNKRRGSDFDDDFTGDNGSAPDSSKWGDLIVTGGTVTSSINNNRLRLESTSFGNGKLPNLTQFSGDFDIQCDWHIIVGPNYGTSWWGAGLRLTVMDGAQAGWEYSIERVFVPQAIGHAFRYTKQPGNVISETNTSLDDGQFRFTRVGSSVKAYQRSLSTGDTWVNSYDIFPSETGTLQVSLSIWTGNSNPGMQVEFDNVLSN